MAEIDIAELKRLRERYATRLPLHANDTPDYAEIVDGKGEVIAMTTEPELIAAVNALPTLLSRIESLEAENKRLSIYESAERRRTGDEFIRLLSGDRAFSRLERLRRYHGLTVAVHNDYRLNGEPMTFWLFTTPDGRAIKGEGATDEIALAQVEDQHARAALSGEGHAG